MEFYGFAAAGRAHKMNMEEKGENGAPPLDVARINICSGVGLGD